MSAYQAPGQSDSLNRIKSGYGGSDSSKPSFNRSGYVKYNTFSKARDLGSIVNINANLTGTVGTEVGANTQYFKVLCESPSHIRIFRNEIHKQTDKHISVGLLDSNRKSFQLNDHGFAYLNEILNTDTKETLLALPSGVYYFTVSSSQWQSLPYSFNIHVIRFLGLEGRATGTMIPSGRIAMVKMYGKAIVSAVPLATVREISKIKKPIGAAGGGSTSYGELAGLFGTVHGTMFTAGRLKPTWHLNGSATGSSPSSAVLSSFVPNSGGGGGY